MNQSKQIIDEIEKVIVGKRQKIEKILMAILAGGHILIDDMPGVGKTTIALVFAKTLGLQYQRIQFTPDVLPSDIVGFSMYQKETGQFIYMPGVVTNTNILLVDEINRASSKTQSALLEAMEEFQVTVDGNTYPLLTPFFVIATENQIGTAGTQTLPHAQLDRFLVKLGIGYPDFQSQMEIIRDRLVDNPINYVEKVLDAEQFLQMHKEAMSVTMKDEIVEYITRLTIATRESEDLDLGVSPRGAIALGRMARAHAYVKERDYVIPQDVVDVFCDVCAHRVMLSAKGKGRQAGENMVLQNILSIVKHPYQI